MPGKVKVKIISGRNLPVMDRSSDTTDAYVEIKLGNTTYKTDVCRKSLHPQWNSEWYRFEVDDAELQDEPLQIRLMDYDMYSANDAIGKVYIDLNPLLLPMRNHLNAPSGPNTSSLENAYPNSAGSNILSTGSTKLPGSVFSGWIPVFDTMHGIRGEVNVSVKIELFNDFNKFRQSSCGVQFFYTSTIPYGYHARVVHGFVEELVVNDDPEYHWIDKIRTPRASNEARQTLFFKLSGEVQRKIGIKAIDIGANCVIGYHQRFDFEGDSGIVARGIGTAVTLVRLHDLDQDLNKPQDEIGLVVNPIATKDQFTNHGGHCRTESVGSKATKLNSISNIHRRSSDSDLSVTPKGNSLSSSERPNLNPGTSVISGAPPQMKQTNWELLEFPFITMTTFPPGFIKHIGGTVSSRSVKLLERISNLEEPESRDAWWTEIRLEIRSHARALACNVVIGYTEHATICDDVCVLSASGTAAVIKLHQTFSTKEPTDFPILLSRTNSINPSIGTTVHNPLNDVIERIHQTSISPTATEFPNDIFETDETDCESHGGFHCQMCHVPYSESSVPYPIVMLRCAVCRIGRVPDVLIATIDLPEECLTVGSGSLVQAHVFRFKRDVKAESNAKEISDSLPFLEYDLYRLLINKLKVKGMNALFGLKVQLSLGERMLIGNASGTGVYLLPLPTPSLPKLVAGVTPANNNDHLTEMQRNLAEAVRKNKEYYQVRTIDVEESLANQHQLLTINPITTEEDLEDAPKLDLTLGNKDSCILEIDDGEDADILSLLMENTPPKGFTALSTEYIPGLEEFQIKTHLQMFTQMTRVKVPTHQPSLRLGRLSQRLLQTVYFKMRRMTPCILSQVRFRVDIPDNDEIQLTAYGTAMGLKNIVSKFAGSQNRSKRKLARSISKDVKKLECEDIFTLDEDDKPKINVDPILPTTNPRNVHDSLLGRVVRKHRRHGIDITSLSYIPGGHILQYLGNINFFFIRESTSIRECDFQGSGLSGFVHSFVTEVLAIVRAHIAALGGNAMVAYFMNECVLFRNPHKNQGQCLVNVGGDVVFVSYHQHNESQKYAQNSNLNY